METIRQDKTLHMALDIQQENKKAKTDCLFLCNNRVSCQYLFPREG